MLKTLLAGLQCFIASSCQKTNSFFLFFLVLARVGAQMYDYCRFLIFHEYLIPRLNFFASNCKNKISIMPNFYHSFVEFTPVRKIKTRFKKKSMRCASCHFRLILITHVLIRNLQYNTCKIFGLSQSQTFVRIQLGVLYLTLRSSLMMLQNLPIKKGMFCCHFVRIQIDKNAFLLILREKNYLLLHL